jgi:hypothetical protein
VELLAGPTPPDQVLVLLEGGGEVLADRLNEVQLMSLDEHQVRVVAQQQHRICKATCVFDCAAHQGCAVSCKQE